MYKKLKSKIQTKLNSQDIHTTIFKYINNYTGEISNYPILENIIVILNPSTKEFSKLTYIFSWRKIKYPKNTSYLQIKSNKGV